MRFPTLRKAPHAHLAKSPRLSLLTQGTIGHLWIRSDCDTLVSTLSTQAAEPILISKCIRGVNFASSVHLRASVRQNGFSLPAFHTSSLHHVFPGRSCRPTFGLHMKSPARLHLQDLWTPINSLWTFQICEVAYPRASLQTSFYSTKYKSFVPRRSSAHSSIGRTMTAAHDPC